MCSINHDLKAIFIHIPKTGGSYISNVLSKHYGFKNYYLKRPDHNQFCRIVDSTVDKHENKLFGTYLYYKTSPQLCAIMNMNEFKWNSYKIFTFIRDPIKRLISGYKYCRENNQYKNVNFELFYNNSTKLNCWTYWHCFMPQIRHIVNENNENVCFFIGRQENLEKDLNELLVGFGLKSIHIHYFKNKTKHDDFINQFNEDVKYHSKFLYKLFDEDYKRLILNEELLKKN